MHLLRHRRPSAALVVACIALAVALSGTSYAVSVQFPRASVGTVQLKDGAVTSRKVRDNTITTVDVRNRSLLANDFARGQIPAGPTGPQGPAGPAGPQGPAGLTGLQIVNTSSGIDSLDTHSTTASCPSGKKVTGGGASIINNEEDAVMLVNQPSGDAAWSAVGVEADSTTESWGVQAWAICATVTS